MEMIGTDSVIDTILDEFGITAAQFSKETGFGEGTVSNWRSGKRRISASAAKVISDKYPKYSVDDILFGCNFGTSQRARFEKMLHELGLSGAEFARRTGLSDVSVSRWRSGTRKIRRDAATKIERCFPQYSADWIMGSSPTPSGIMSNLESMGISKLMSDGATVEFLENELVIKIPYAKR